MIFRWIDVQNKHSISCKNLHHSSRLYNGMLSCYPLGNATVEIHAETLTPWITRAGERYNMLFDRANKRIMTPNAEIHTGQTATFFLFTRLRPTAQSLHLTHAPADLVYMRSIMPHSAVHSAAIVVVNGYLLLTYRRTGRWLGATWSNYITPIHREVDYYKLARMRGTRQAAGNEHLP